MKNKSLYIYYSLFFVLFLGATRPLIGQKSPGKADPEIMSLIREAKDEKGKETGAVIILRDYQLIVNEKGETKMVIRILGKVFTREAMSDFNQIPLPYNSYYEEPALEYARVIHSDGTVREVPKDAVQIKTAPESEGLQYTDIRYLSFALSGMEVGAAFDYKVTFTQKKFIIEGEWYDNHFFPNLLRNMSPPYLPRIDPTMTSRYTLLLPKGMKFQYHLYQGEGEPKKRSLNGQDEYQWVFTNLPSLKIEDGMPSIGTLNTILIVSSINNWSQIDKWASGKLLPKVEISDEIKSKSKELTLGMNTAEEKIKAISDYIQGNIQYIYADLDRGGYTPHGAGEIFKSKYGDCKDQSILLISMLKAVGIEAFPVLLNPFPYDEAYEIPGPEFSHMITYIPNDKGDYWLDMTSGVTPFPDLYSTDQGRKVFIVNGKGGRLTTTPVADATKNTSNFVLTSSFSGTRAIIDMKISSSGMQSEMMKSLFKGLDHELRDQGIQEMVKSFVGKATIDSIRLSDVNNPNTPFSVAINIGVDSMWMKGQTDISFGSYSMFPLSLFTNIDVQSFPPKRYNDIAGSYNYSVKGTERCIPPGKDLLIVSAPHNDSVKNGYFDLVRTISKEGNVSVVKWSLTESDSVVPKEKYESWVKWIKSVKEMSNWKITYVDPLQFIPSVIKSETSARIMTYCNDLLKDDPKNLLAFLLRGMTYFSSNQTDQALKVFEEAKKIAPGSKYPYFYSTIPLMAKKDIPAALANMDKAIELDPEFETALFLRSSIYSDQGFFEKALPDLNRILVFDSLNLYCLSTKSSVLAKMGKETESIAVIEDAIKKDPANAGLWAILAEKNLSKKSAGKAVELYNKAISLDSTKSNFFGNLGWAYYLSENDEKCIECSRKAAELDPGAYYARFNLGLACLRSGKIAESRSVYEELQKERNSISGSVRAGAIKDLYELKNKGVYTKEIKAILKDFFGI